MKTTMKFSSGMALTEKLNAIVLGETHARQHDAAGVEHIGLITSYSGIGWVYVSDIEPPQSGRNKTEDVWNVVTIDIEIPIQGGQ